MHIVVFSDLDGTLLNHHDYSFHAAKPALAMLGEAHIPLVPVSSKTAAELWEIRKALQNEDPFVCENGSIVFIPPSLTDSADAVLQSESSRVNGYRCYYRGSKREEILKVLKELGSQYKFTGFAGMNIRDIASLTGLSIAAASAANDRYATEPIVWQDTEEALNAFSTELKRHALRIVKGGRFHHVMGECDKGDAVRDLVSIYEKYYADSVHSIGLGDGPNDIDMLRNVSTAIVMPGINGDYIKDENLKDALYADRSAAEGWNETVGSTVGRLLNIQETKERTTI